MTQSLSSVISQLILIFMLAIPIMIVDTATIPVPSFRVLRITRNCEWDQVALTYFSFVAEGCLEIGLAFLRGDDGDYPVSAHLR